MVILLPLSHQDCEYYQVTQRPRASSGFLFPPPSKGLSIRTIGRSQPHAGRKLFPPRCRPALVLAPFLLPGLFVVLFLTARVRCEVGAWWGGAALWGTLLCRWLAGAGFIDEVAGQWPLRGLGESCNFSYLSLSHTELSLSLRYATAFV